MTLEEYVKKIEALDLDKMLEREAACRKVKRFFVKVAGLAAAIGLLAGLKVNAAEYPGLLRVEQTEGNTVTGRDANGFTWSFESEFNDYVSGDLCAVTFEDNGTEIIFDDKIVSARYVGSVKMYAK